MELLVTSVIKTLILPPGFFLILFATSLLLLRKWPVIGRSLLWTGLVILYLLSTPIIAGFLLNRLEIYPALDANNIEDSTIGAIVILASDRERGAKEYGGDSVGFNTLIRCRYGAFLQRKTGLPIMVSGGYVLDTEGRSLAETMAESLKEDFRAGEVWLEDKSRTTAENGFYSHKILAQKKINTVYLVTQAWHMPRSVAVFEKAGLKVIPAPTAFKGSDEIEIQGLLPGANALNTSRLALYEMIGILWYEIRYW